VYRGSAATTVVVGNGDSSMRMMLAITALVRETYYSSVLFKNVDRVRKSVTVRTVKDATVYVRTGEDIEGDSDVCGFICT
jgi:DNA-binding beta-propeller fold protein YncE